GRIVLTVVARNNEGHLAYRSQSANPLQGTTVGGPADDPRGEGTRTAAACHSARRAVGQCQPGLSGGRHLAGPVLSLAPARGGGRGAAPYLQPRWQLRVAPSTVQRALRRAGLAPRRQRLLVLEQRALQTAGPLTAGARRALWP